MVKCFYFFVIAFLFSACSMQSWIIEKQVASLQPTLPLPPPICDLTLSNSYGGGEGTAQNPFRVCNLAQWNYLASTATDWSKNFKLESDIDFTGIDPSTFLSVGNGTTAFTGTFDGNSYALKNLNLLAGTTSLAFFNTTDSGATFKNLKLNSINIVSNFRASALIVDHSLGVLTLENIEMNNVTIDVSTSVQSGNGALVGNSYGTIQINGLNANHVWTKLADRSDSGGLIGHSEIINVDGAIIDDLKITTGGGMSTSTGGFIGSTTNFMLRSPSSFKNMKITNLDAQLTWLGAGILTMTWGDTLFEKVIVQGTVFASAGQSGFLGTAQITGGFRPSVTITDSSFTGTLSNDGNSIYGGLVGTASGNVTIQRSFFSGGLSVWSGSVGGLIGSLSLGPSNRLLIEDSYFSGNITMTHATQGHAGHLAGSVNGPSTSIIEVRRSFASGAHLGSAGASRSCIMNISPNVTWPSFTFQDVKYNSTLCTGSPDFDTALGAGIAALNTASLQTATPFTNWLGSVWSFANAANPKLIWEP